MKKFILVALCMGIYTTLWAKPTPIKKSIFQKQIVADSLDEYLGEYKMKDFFSVYKVTKDEGFLFGEADSFGNNKLLRLPLEITFQKYGFQKIHSFVSGFFILSFIKLRIIPFYSKWKWTTFSLLQLVHHFLTL